MLMKRPTRLVSVTSEYLEETSDIMTSKVTRTNHLGLCRLEDRVTPAAGDLDQTFSGDGIQTLAFDLVGGGSDLVNDMALQADGKIILIGDVQRSGANTDIGIVRFNPDGSLDTTFGVNGKQVVSFDMGGSNADTANVTVHTPVGTSDGGFAPVLAA